MLTVSKGVVVGCFCVTRALILFKIPHGDFKITFNLEFCNFNSRAKGTYIRVLVKLLTYYCLMNDLKGHLKSKSGNTETIFFFFLFPPPNIFY